jgi:hypothetical protein
MHCPFRSAPSALTGLPLYLLPSSAPSTANCSNGMTNSGDNYRLRYRLPIIPPRTPAPRPSTPRRKNVVAPARTNAFHAATATLGGAQPSCQHQLSRLCDQFCSTGIYVSERTDPPARIRDETQHERGQASTPSGLIGSKSLSSGSESATRNCSRGKTGTTIGLIRTNSRRFGPITSSTVRLATQRLNCSGRLIANVGRLVSRVKFYFQTFQIDAKDSLFSSLENLFHLARIISFHPFAFRA